MPTIYSNLIKSHARLVGLLALKRGLKNGDISSSEILTQNADIFERSYFEKKSRIFFSQCLINNNISSKDITQSFIMAPSQKSDKYFLSPSDIVGKIIEHKKYKFQEKIMVTQEKWRQGIALLHQLELDFLVELAESVDLIIGINGEWACIQAFSNPYFPGFMAFNVNAPPVILAEQQVHEATHIVLSAKLSVKGEYADLTNKSIAAFSPFTDSVRTLDRVIHGVISYASVLKLWEALSKNPSLLNDQGNCINEDPIEIILDRISIVSNRIILAIQCIKDVLSEHEFSLFASLYSEFYDNFEDLLKNNISRTELLESAGYSLDISSLNPIQQAELLFSQIGNKVSRISVPMSNIKHLGFALTGATHVVPSSWVVNPILDENLNGFSNVCLSESHVLDSTNSSEVHLYLGNKIEFVQEAARLDFIGKAGPILGIPNCCCDFFANNWESQLSNGGDLFALLVRKNSHDGIVKMPRELDFSAMYRGGGLCWHFPCSIDCQPSIEIIRRRREILKAINPALLIQLESSYVDETTLLESGKYSSAGEDQGILIKFQ